MISPVTENLLRLRIMNSVKIKNVSMNVNKFSVQYNINSLLETECF